MNEELEAQLAKVLEKSLELAEQTGDFVIEQAPLLLQEFYSWHIISSCLGILLGICLLLVAIFLGKIFGSKKEITEYGDVCPKYFGRYYKGGSLFAFSFIGGGLAVSSIITICINIYDLVFILTAPKLYLIEYFIK